MASGGRGRNNPPDAHNPTSPTTGNAGAALSVPKPQTAALERVLVETFEQIRDELVSTLAYVLGNRDDALDSAQETFVKCWKARQTISEVQNLRAWIFRVGLNAARDFQRSGWTKRAKPLIAEEVLLPAGGVSAAEQIVENENVTRLRQAILELRPEEREVFLLRQNGELTYEQIAELREIPVGTVKTQMRTALIKLRKVLNPDADAAPDEV